MRSMLPEASIESSLVWNWPFSVSRPMSEDDPGPPLSQTATGAVDGLVSHSINLAGVNGEWRKMRRAVGTRRHGQGGPVV